MRPRPQPPSAITADKKKKKPKVAKTDRVVASKDTRRENKKDAKLNPLVGKDANLPDKALYDKALLQTNKGHFDVARLDLQTLLNTYPDSQYLMRAKLAIADSWFREGGSAALTQAEQEYTDFITFFPNAPEAAEAQMRVGDIYFKQMDVPDRDYQKAMKAEEAYRLMLKQYADGNPKLLADATQKLREVQEVLAARDAEHWRVLCDPRKLAGQHCPLRNRRQHVSAVQPHGRRADRHRRRVCRGSQIARPRAEHARRLPPKGKLLAQGTTARPPTPTARLCWSTPRQSTSEDAKERLVAMNLPVPRPHPSRPRPAKPLEGSRAQYTFQKRMLVLLTAPARHRHHRPHRRCAAGGSTACRGSRYLQEPWWPIT